MRAAHVVEILTPKKVHLNGLWFGPRRARSVIIMVHGLTGTAFSMQGTVVALLSTGSAVLTFSNRGNSQITTLGKGVGKRKRYILAGTAHEVFANSVDDIDGAVRLALRQGAERIFLAGHSTGAQKITYWASKRKHRAVKGLLLLGPLSDYSATLKTFGKRKLEKSVAHARKLIRAGKPHELMPRTLREWFECDAQRFLSLYTPESKEEIFTYARPSARPVLLERIRLPIFALLAGADEYADKPVWRIYDWFLQHIWEGEVAIIPKVGHSFKGGEKQVAKLVGRFMKEH